MSRIERIGDATLYLGDCRDILPTLDGIDAVITDPPYLLDPTSRAHADPFNRNTRWEIEARGLNLGVDVADLLVAPHVVSFCSKKQLKDYIISAESAEYVWTLICWHKNNPTPLAKRNYLPDTEYIFHMWKGVELGGTYATKRKWYVTDVERSTVDHPTVKPSFIMENLVQNAVPRGGLVVDPFMGSGTTGVACAKLGRSFIGVEIDEDYFDIACERISKAYDQPDMFIAPPVPAKQEALDV